MYKHIKENDEIMRKYKLIILEAIVAIILLCTSVYAAINVNLSFRVTNRELNPGEEFKVRLTLNQIELENNKGITDIEGYINYNDDVIEEITAESITKNADGKVVIAFQINNNIMTKSAANAQSEVIELDVPAQLINDRTLVPIRAISESFGCNVDWVDATQTVVITTK